MPRGKVITRILALLVGDSKTVLSLFHASVSPHLESMHLIVSSYFCTKVDGGENPQSDNAILNHSERQ